MGKNERSGNGRQYRSANRRFRIPELGYYFIFTDTQETEQNYFYGIRDSIPEHLKDKLMIKVNRAATVDLISKCKEMLSLEPQYRIPWIIFDRDQVNNFDAIIQNAEKAGINVGWSNPCIEIWFYAYFGAMPKHLDSPHCCNEFATLYERVVGRKYKKSDRTIYAALNSSGDERKAIQLAKQKYYENIRDGKIIASEMCPCTTVHLLVEEIMEKVCEKNL